MPYARPTLTQEIDQVQQDIQNSPYGNGNGLLDPSPLTVLGYAMSGVSYEHYGYQDYIARNATPWGATGEYAAGWGALKGVFLKPATTAVLQFSFPGTVGTVLPAGSGISSPTGIAYTTSAAASVGSNGSVVVTATANGSGAAFNAAIGSSAQLSAPVSGINGNGTVVEIVAPGTDQESSGAFKTRYLAKYASPPQGGAQQDYVEWAEQVPGVTRAWCAPNGAGAGSVVVFIMLDQANAASNGFPLGTDGAAAGEQRWTAATGNQLTVANALYPLRPATALVIVVAPQPAPQTIVISGIGVAAAALQPAIEAAIAQLFLDEGDAEGTFISPSDLYDAIGTVEGVGSFSVASPTGAITTPIGSLPTVGQVTVS